jgi:hypothetical protein
MKKNHNSRAAELCGRIDRQLAAYLAAAGAVGAVMASEAHAVVVSNSTVQPFGINGEVRIDFNSDGQTDFSIDHDRVTLPSGGPTLDYLQIDKNDINGEGNPLAFDPGPDIFFAATPFSDGLSTRNDASEAAHVINGVQGSYPAALTAGTPIGPGRRQRYSRQSLDRRGRNANRSDSWRPAAVRRAGSVRQSGWQFSWLRRQCWLSRFEDGPQQRGCYQRSGTYELWLDRNSHYQRGGCHRRGGGLGLSNQSGPSDWGWGSRTELLDFGGAGCGGNLLSICLEAIDRSVIEAMHGCDVVAVRLGPPWVWIDR